MSDAALTELALRALLVVLFLPFSALDKIFDFSGAVAQAQEVFSSRALAVALILVGLGVEIVMPLGILSGVADRLAAFVLAGYCGVTAILFKRFWEKGDFWRRGASQGRTMFWDFLKNFSLAGGFLLLTIGLHGAGLAAFLSHPLASSQPYALAARP